MDINQNATILVEWMLDVSYYRFVSQTILAVRYVDRTESTHDSWEVAAFGMRVSIRREQVRGDALHDDARACVRDG